MVEKDQWDVTYTWYSMELFFYALGLCHLHVFCIKQDGKAFALAIVTNKAKQLTTPTDLKD